MSSYIVLTAVGPDRPGLVDEISAFLAARNVNIEDSCMAVLGGEFAVILLGSGEAGALEKLADNLVVLKKNTSLSIQMKQTIAPNARQVPPSLPHRLSATSMDHPGIVHEISRILHKRNINIESLGTHVAHAPVSGTPLFTMKCIINIPVGEKLSSLRRELEELGDCMDIDIEIETADACR
ncbi:MAG: hypothetical protein A2W19_00135 [Spirochaetes bacterium RBG_16_49_21]|nr:MAG: hypothetical protein A2W19_00135 [Spirochaetes bacterium RBG_16_49_21]